MKLGIEIQAFEKGGKWVYGPQLHLYSEKGFGLLGDPIPPYEEERILRLLRVGRLVEAYVESLNQDSALTAAQASPDN